MIGLSRETVLQAKRRLLRLHYECGVGHIGGNLSCLDILLTLYHSVMVADDVCVLSKGHSAGALYVTLWSVGRLSEDDLLTYYKDGTRLSAHPPPRGIPDIVCATGSLGHGLGFSTGLALGKRLDAAPGRVVCITSDGEWNEGSNWESLIFMAHHGLENLLIVVDGNGMQGFGPTCEVADLEPLADKFRAFGLDCREIDGHDIRAIHTALADPTPGPRAIIARTHKGNGVSFMQDQWEWHYLPMNDRQYHQALQELK